MCLRRSVRSQLLRIAAGDPWLLHFIRCECLCSPNHSCPVWFLANNSGRSLLSPASLRIYEPIRSCMSVGGQPYQDQKACRIGAISIGLLCCFRTAEPPLYHLSRLRPTTPTTLQQKSLTRPTYTRSVLCTPARPCVPYSTLRTHAPPLRLIPWPMMAFGIEINQPLSGSP